MTPCLALPGNAEEAIHFYVAAVEGSSVIHIERYGKDAPMPEGTAMVITAQIGDSTIHAINGPAQWEPSQAMSLMVHCDGQEQLDRTWEALLDGGAPMASGWLKDRYGVSWQIVPRCLFELLSDGDAERKARVMNALWGMIKLDEAALRAAAEAPA